MIDSGICESTDFSPYVGVEKDLPQYVPYSTIKRIKLVLYYFISLKCVYPEFHKYNLMLHTYMATATKQLKGIHPSWCNIDDFNIL